MSRFRMLHNLRFSTKVLAPVVAVMVLVLALTGWMVNRRLTQQFQSDAVRSLTTADAVFRSFQKIRRNTLLTRFRNLPNEPRYRATFQNADPKTLKAQLKDMPDDQKVDVVMLTAIDGKAHSFKRDPSVMLGEFETNSALVVQKALAGEEAVDTICAGERLFDVVSIPVLGASGELSGALTFGDEISDDLAKDISEVTHSQIILLANGRVMASTLPGIEPGTQLASLLDPEAASSGQRVAAGGLSKLLLRDEHYFCATGGFASSSGNGRLGYLLLWSYEQPLQSLHHTQQVLVLLSAIGILLGTAVVWFLVRKLTQPLRVLRNTAEAVGRGDFSRRLEVTSGDECGELAAVFNQMTENLQNSRAQLERTVETLKTTQAQLVQSEKLSGIGEFVAGVAHELNNPLTSVMGFSELLKQADTDPQHQRFLDMIHKSAVRCQKIVQNLLSFARRHPPERKLSSVNELAECAIEFLHYQLRTSNIEVLTNLDPHLPKAMVDPHQIQQVFLNLLNNARQAIEAHQPSGRVRVTTETCGQTVRILFEDNGPGIPEANLSKVFDPFFTTKADGKGTGLGLSLCYGIIKEHGGAITVRSQPGQGATFCIELPLAVGGENPRAARSAPLARIVNGRRQGLGKRVLVIDDEDAILQMVCETLLEHGFQVDVAQDGETALRRVAQTPYDLALCDWKMPGLNGEQVYERLRATNPALSERLIFITGDVISDRTQRFLQEQKKVCLSKPFSLSEFCAAIDRALAA